MGGRRKLQFQGNELWGEEVDFETEHESFNTYLLHDGTKLKLKTVVSEIVRLDAYNPDGDPVYVIKSTNIVSAVVPDQLKRKA